MRSRCTVTATLAHRRGGNAPSTVNGGSPLASDPGRRSHTTRPEWSWPTAKSVSQKLLASIIIEALCRGDRGLTSSVTWTLPEVRTRSSQAGDPGVRALFISPNRRDPSAVRVTWLATMRGGSQRNGWYAITASRTAIPARSRRHNGFTPAPHWLTSRTP